MLEVKDGRALLLLTPETGRTHQLRVHAATGLGCPIVGDPVYGHGGQAPSGSGMLLHARALTLPRPGKAAIFAQAPLPPRFAAAGFALPEAVADAA